MKPHSIQRKQKYYGKTDPISQWLLFRPSVDEMKRIWLIALKKLHFPSTITETNLIISELKYFLEGSLHVVQMLTQQIMDFEQNRDV
jgi:hypothetical protein